MSWKGEEQKNKKSERRETIKATFTGFRVVRMAHHVTGRPGDEWNAAAEKGRCALFGGLR